MAEEQKNSSAETVDAATSAAHTVKGAIKAGKAISGAAKGAAAGGHYGAVAGAVWAGRKHIGKIIAIIAILLLLPVLFLLMLPGLIFGGLVNAFSPADPDTPILNSETAIVENANDITFTINAILGEALDDVIARIEEDFASSGADQMEIKNPYSSGPVYNANLIISQYCAARDEDFESISLDGLASALREHKEHLYSYTSVQESREVTAEDPETGEEITTTETWIVYTIRYNGESYLADTVFALTDEQKELAADYASNLSLFLGDGLLQNLVEWTGNSIPSLYISVSHPPSRLSSPMVLQPSLPFRMQFLRAFFHYSGDETHDLSKHGRHPAESIFLFCAFSHIFLLFPTFFPFSFSYSLLFPQVVRRESQLLPFLLASFPARRAHKLKKDREPCPPVFSYSSGL